MTRHYGVPARDTMSVWPQAAEEHDNWSPRRKLLTLLGLCLFAWAVVIGIAGLFV